jgi:hypothetical protein
MEWMSEAQRRIPEYIKVACALLLELRIPCIVIADLLIHANLNLE